MVHSSSQFKGYKFDLYPSFAPFPGSLERDVRFVYCAFVICHLFNAFPNIGQNSAVNYMMSCRASSPDSQLEKG